MAFNIFKNTNSKVFFFSLDEMKQCYLADSETFTGDGSVFLSFVSLSIADTCIATSSIFSL